MYEGDRITRRSALRKGIVAVGALVIGGTATGGTAAAGVGNGRVAHYHLNGLQGPDGARVHDASPHANHGTNSGAEVVGGNVGNALEFTAENHNHVSIGHDPSLEVEEVTITAWVNGTGKQFEYIFDGPGHNYYLKESDNSEKPEFGFFSGGSFYRVVATRNLPTGAWSHVAATYDGNIMKIYIDGTEDAVNDAPSGPIDTYSSTARVDSGEARIGRYLERGPGDGYFYNGKLDEVRIYNRALMDDEIQSLASMGGESD